jgi:hypothetical protein
MVDDMLGLLSRREVEAVRTSWIATDTKGWQNGVLF